MSPPAHGEHEDATPNALGRPGDHPGRPVADDVKAAPGQVKPPARGPCYTAVHSTLSPLTPTPVRMQNIFTALISQATESLPQPQPPTLTETYINYLATYPVLVVIATLVATSITAKAAPRLIGLAIGLLTNTIWDVTKQAAIAAVSPFVPNFGQKNNDPHLVRYTPKQGHTWGKHMGTAQQQLICVNDYDSAGRVHYDYAGGDPYTSHLASFRHLLSQKGFERLS